MPAGLSLPPSLAPADGYAIRWRHILRGAGFACLLVLVAAAWSNRMDDARRALPDATVRFDSLRGALVIDGPIGPGTRATLARRLLQGPRIRELRIDSPGGLVQDALEIGDLVQAAGLPVRVDHRCASACVLIWAASPRRTLAPGARIGLHRSSNLSGLPALLAMPWSRGLERDAVRRLREAGFSQAVLGQRERTAPQSMLWLDAASIAADGVHLDADPLPANNPRVASLM